LKNNFQINPFEKATENAIYFSVFNVHIGAPALKAISIPFSCFIVRRRKEMIK
jgi:hypothetical protein